MILQSMRATAGVWRPGESKVMQIPGLEFGIQRWETQFSNFLPCRVPEWVIKLWDLIFCLLKIVIIRSICQFVGTLSEILKDYCSLTASVSDLHSDIHKFENILAESWLNCMAL